MQHKIECPFCDGIAVLHKELKELPFRKEVFKTIEHFYICEKCNEEFTTTESDTVTIMQVYNQYREKYKIPFPEEIIAIRDKYELSAAKMSEVLGLGVNGYGNYEKGEIPTAAIGNLIATMASPTVFIQFLEKAQAHFSATSFEKTKQIVYSLVKEEKTHSLLYSFLNIYNEPNSYTGYKKTDAKKIGGLVKMFIQKCKQEFNDKLKLNKLLFFTDFCHYKNYGKSISGLSYRAIQYGPVPTNYDNIYTYLENEQAISSEWMRLANGSAREIFKAETILEKDLFDEKELNTINKIINHFHDTPTWDIVDLSHKEKAWKDLEKGKKVINYQEYAFDLEGV